MSKECIHFFGPLCMYFLRTCCKYRATLYVFTYMPSAHAHRTVCTAQVHKTVERNFPRTYRRELPSTKLILYSFTEFEGKGIVLEQNSQRRPQTSEEEAERVRIECVRGPTMSLVVIHNLLFPKSLPHCWISRCIDACFRIKLNLDFMMGGGLIFTFLLKNIMFQTKNFV